MHRAQRAVSGLAGCAVTGGRAFAVVGLTILTVVAPALAVEQSPINDLPSPFRTVRDWATPPGGEWAAITAVEVAPDGSVYVIHRCKKNSCIGRHEPPILKFDKDGRFIKAWGEDMFTFPHGSAVDADGNLWVTDLWVHEGKGSQVFKFSPDGKVLMTLGKPGVVSDAPGFFDEPSDVAIAPNGDIFVTEGHSRAFGFGTKGNDRVSKFDKDGAFLKSWGKTGSGPDELFQPHTVSLDSGGRLFVGDRGNNRVQVFDQDGKLLESLKQWSRPSAIAITPDDGMYVADSESFGPDNPGWKKGIRIGSAKDGTVRYFIPDLEATTTEHSGAESVAIDSQGSIYAGVVRRQMLEKHIPSKGDPASAPR